MNELDNKIISIKNDIERVLSSSNIPSFYTVNARNLLLGTIAQESNFKYVKQLGNGPARSYFQIEPATAIDVISNYINYRELLKKELKNISGNKNLTLNNIGDELLNNFDLAIFICRMCYYRRNDVVLNDKQKLSEKALAVYWKKYYNTIHGKGSEEEFIKNYQLYLTKIL